MNQFDLHIILTLSNYRSKVINNFDPGYTLNICLPCLLQLATEL